MQLIGTQGSINSIVIRLDSIHTNLRLDICPGYLFRDGPIEEANEAEIIFKDSYEVDMLIKALEKFKDSNYRYFGDWRLMSNV